MLVSAVDVLLELADVILSVLRRHLAMVHLAEKESIWRPETQSVCKCQSEMKRGKASEEKNKDIPFLTLFGMPSMIWGAGPVGFGRSRNNNTTRLLRVEAPFHGDGPPRPTQWVV